MRLMNLLLVSAVVLQGCAVPAEHREPYKTIVVDKPAREIYEGLKAHPFCEKGWMADAQYDAYDNSFKIAYRFAGFMGPTEPSDVVIGRAAGEASTELKMMSAEKWRTPISDQVLTRVLTGSCK